MAVVLQLADDALELADDVLELADVVLELADVVLELAGVVLELADDVYASPAWGARRRCSGHAGRPRLRRLARRA